MCDYLPIQRVFIEQVYLWRFLFVQISLVLHNETLRKLSDAPSIGLTRFSPSGLVASLRA